MFLISIFLVFLSSYLILSSILSTKEKSNAAAFLYFLLIAFAQIVLTFEILSLFSLIKPKPFLIINLIIFILALFLKKKLFVPSGIKNEFRKIKNAIKLDKMLSILSIFFIVFLIASLTNIFLFPVSNGDALEYYLTRCTMWIQNGNINHFITPDPREIIMPVNMEFLYSWVLLLRKSEYGIGIFSYISFLSAIFVLYNLLKEFKYCIRKRLWSIFIFSSFMIIASMSYAPCADLFVGALLLTSIYLFYLYLKKEDKIALFFSTLACALSFGTKTTAIIAFPSIAVIFAVLTYINKKEKFIQIALTYISILLFNFLIFSSYNYILNFIQFKNPVSGTESLYMNAFRGGFKSYICTLIKYFFSIFDFSGIAYIDFYNEFITKARDKVLEMIGAAPNSYMSQYYKENFPFNESTAITSSGLGAMGLLAFLPALIKSLSNKKSILFLFGSAFIFNILLFSRVMFYTEFNLRYLVTFVVISSPILALTYIKSNKNLYKWLIFCFLFEYLLFIALTKPLTQISINIKNHKETKMQDIIDMINEEQKIYKYIKKQGNKNILLLSKEIDYHFEKIRLDGIIVDNALIEEIENYDLQKYDYIITNKKEAISGIVKNLNKNSCKYYNQSGYEIKSGSNDVPVRVKCKIPFDYFQSKGFKQVDDIHLTDYTILKKNLLH